ncbi:MAG: SoxR reducing system RseC family protein [Rhodothermaceae bacterium]
MSDQELNTIGKEEVFEEGFVVSIEEGYAHIDVTEGGDCEACNARAFCKPKDDSRLLTVVDPLGVKPGDKIRFKIGGSTLFKASLLLYGVPLIILVGGILTGMELFSELPKTEAYAFLLGAVSTALYYGIIFLYGKIFKQDNSMPVIASIIKPEKSASSENCNI